MISPQLEVRNLCKSYDEGRIEALRGVDLSIAARRISGHQRTQRQRQIHLAATAGGTRHAHQRRSPL